MPFGSIINKNFKSLCNLLRIFETRLAITIMTNQHQHHNCEEDITILDIIKIIAHAALCSSSYCLFTVVTHTVVTMVFVLYLASIVCNSSFVRGSICLSEALFTHG